MEKEKLPLSVVILARNEADNIVPCIESADFADEIMVIENNSEDNTVELAKAYGARVLFRDLNGDYAAQRNFGIENAKYEWILMLDADERITDVLREEIIQAVREDKDFCYRLSRENHFVQGRVLHGDLRPDHVERLFRKSRSRYEGLVHERLHSDSPGKDLKGRLIHFPYRSWEAHLAKMNLYSTMVARKYYEKGRKCNFLLDILIKPYWAFFKVYFIHLGFLDGALGWNFSVLHYMYTMEKYLKLNSLVKYGGRL